MALLLAFSQLLLIHSFVDLPLSSPHTQFLCQICTWRSEGKPQNTLWSRLSELKPLGTQICDTDQDFPGDISKCHQG